MLNEAGKLSSVHHAIARVQPYNLFLQNKQIAKRVVHDLDEESSRQICETPYHVFVIMSQLLLPSLSVLFSLI